MAYERRRAQHQIHTHLHDPFQVMHLCSCFHAGLSMPLRLCCKMLSMRLSLHVGLLVCHCLCLRAELIPVQFKLVQEYLHTRHVGLKARLRIEA